MGELYSERCYQIVKRNYRGSSPAVKNQQKLGGKKHLKQSSQSMGGQGVVTVTEINKRIAGNVSLLGVILQDVPL